MTRRIVLTGPEASGKTTLARALARNFRAPWLPEQARLYAEAVKRELTAADAELIAQRTIDADDAALAGDPPLLLLDTDLISTVVYVRHYYGPCPAWIEEAARERRADLYLLCAPDLPWTADGIRDRPEQRREIFALFEGAMKEFDCTVVDVAGAGVARERDALSAANALIAAAGHR
ncbi:MAG TPA: ATP-binding protein [Gemmatimonadaceae bacterium]|nr:ATP-binding protein [Gemmatimonadaceae bacterium]